MKQFNVHGAKTHLSPLLELVETGEEVVIGRAARPIARLVPYASNVPKRIPGAWKDRVWIADDFDEFPAEPGVDLLTMTGNVFGKMTSRMDSGTLAHRRHARVGDRQRRTVQVSCRCECSERRNRV